MNTRAYPFMLAGMILLTGCAAPELAQSSYNPIENEWREYIKHSYPAWNPPKTVPPASAVKESDLEEVDLVEPGEIALPTLIEEEEYEPLVVETESVVELVPESDRETVEYYTVRKGDTLWKIAAKFYQNGADWRRIYEANLDAVSDPGKLRPGVELRIPSK